MRDKFSDIREKMGTRALIIVSVVGFVFFLVVLLPLILGSNAPENNQTTSTNIEPEIKPPPGESAQVSDKRMKGELNSTYILSRKVAAKNKGNYPKPSVLARQINEGQPRFIVWPTPVLRNTINSTSPSPDTILVIEDYTGGNDLCMVGRSASGTLFDLEAHQNKKPVLKRIAIVSGSNLTRVCKS